MPNRRTQELPKVLQPLKSITHSQHLDQEDGLYVASIFLRIPPETLTGITSYLDPPSLLSLARVNSVLCRHVRDDNTWHRAFLCQLLQTDPESDIHRNSASLMLRRFEGSWKDEFMARFTLKSLWGSSRNVNVTHIPVHSPISSMHLMPGHSLLTASVQYGIVARSFPLTGTILPGFLGTARISTGLGIGNPNAEFSPNVTANALTSDGGTAKIAWGFRNGEVAVMTANKIMDVNRRVAIELVRCEVNEGHEGAVFDIAWDKGHGAAVMVTGGADGRVKLWNAKHVRCVWTSQRHTESLIPDPCVKVAVAMSGGNVAAVMKSGEIIVWTGFHFQSVHISVSSISETRIPCPLVDHSQTAHHAVLSLHMDPNGESATILVAYQDDPYFYRLCVDKETRMVDNLTFGDASFGPISSLAPFFATPESIHYYGTKLDENSFIITGDHLGCVSIYDWDSLSPFQNSSVYPMKKFEAHEDSSSVTALAWNGVTLITGSARGGVHVWDALTVEHLKSFSSPVPRVRTRRAGRDQGVTDQHVKQILIGPDKDVVVVSVGDKVMAWRARPTTVLGVSRSSRKRDTTVVTSKKRKIKDGTAKYFQKLEIEQNLSELSISGRAQACGNGNEIDQREGLRSLGLDEVGAVEYVLMLSRDEAIAKAEGNFDNSQVSKPTSSSGIPVSASPSIIFGIKAEAGGRPRHVTPSNQKTHIPPPFRAEPKEAGWDDAGTSAAFLGAAVDIRTCDETQFPPINVNRNITAIDAEITHDKLKVSTSHARPVRFAGSDPDKHTMRSAWATPLTRSSMNSSNISDIWSEVFQGTGHAQGVEEYDDDLMFAIQLSLAEARGHA